MWTYVHISNIVGVTLLMYNQPCQYIEYVNMVAHFVLLEKKRLGFKVV